jgi:DNA phosphorothioation-associated putative methyltransferase
MSDRINAAKTAISRVRESVPVRFFVKEASDGSVLDWGCGKGADVNYFNSLGYFATGWDPCYRNGHVPFDVDSITCFYVLNVISSFEERVACLRSAADHLKDNGRMFIAVRSRKGIERANNNWQRYNDGFITSANTFQHGFTHDELQNVVESAGLVYSKWNAARFVGCIATK